MRAFSLIELMVVIAIVALLSAVAVPAYKDYVIRTKVLNAIQVPDFLAHELAVEFAKNGEFPATLEISGVSFTGGSWNRVDASQDYGDVKSIAFWRSTDSKGLVLVFVLKGLSGMPGYVEPLEAATAPATGAYQSYAVGVREDDNGVLEFVCGHANGITLPNNSIPFEYLPANCDCADILGGGAGWYQTGVCGAT